MQPASIKTTRNDMRNLVRDAQNLFREANLATGERAEELIAKGLSMLDTAVSKAQEFRVTAMETGKQTAKSMDEFVQENPWKAIAIAAGTGLLAGLLITRK